MKKKNFKINQQEIPQIFSLWDELFFYNKNKIFLVKNQ